MRDFPTQVEYLEGLGVLDRGEAAIRKAKAAYRRAYKAVHQRMQRKSMKMVYPQFSKEEYRRLQKLASQQELSVSRLAREAILAWLDARLVLYTDPCIVRIRKHLMDLTAVLQGKGSCHNEIAALHRAVNELVAES